MCVFRSFSTFVWITEQFDAAYTVITPQCHRHVSSRKRKGSARAAINDNVSSVVHNHLFALRVKVLTRARKFIV